MDAESSFTYLKDQLPVWLAQLNELVAYASGKSNEFEAEESLLGTEPTAKRLKATSVQSIGSSGVEAAPSADSAAQPDRSSCTTPLAAEPSASDGQRKRKRPWSIRPAELWPLRQPRRPKKVVHYDSHVQVQLDSMVKDIGIARNNLRKARNAHQASRGFPLPTLRRKGSAGMMASPEAAEPRGKQQSMLATSKAKYAMRYSPHSTTEPDMALFFAADKQLEIVQDLYETAAYQFLRDGDCQVQLNSAKSRLDALVIEAEQSLNTFRGKVTKEDESTQDQSSSDPDTTKASSDSKQQQQQQQRSTVSVDIVHHKFGPTRVCQKLEDMNQRPVLKEPVPIDLSHLAAASPVIEVNDDESDDESLGELDLSRFRASNMARLARAF
ncbi:hypothetical protein DV735_g128, partial [Chaetothyriales sp. CBS 134920]